jgi:hypothetical protein
MKPETRNQKKPEARSQKASFPFPLPFHSSCFLFLVSLCFFPLCPLCLCGSPKKLDPAGWGGDHVGKPLPEFVTGDECLFCHRMDVGPSWPKNRHNLTLRKPDADSPALAALKKAPALKGEADKVEYVLGSSNRLRFLKPAEGYGKLELLSVSWGLEGKDGKLIDVDRPHWDAKKFGEGCAGCHASGVDAKTHAFSALSIECYTCHGEVPANHTKDTSLVFFGKKRKDEARVVTSICAQCHVRTGKSRSSGLPYANHFVAGDNLFRDFQVDLSPEKIKEQNPADRHVLDNVRDVVLLGKEEITCLSCHNVHGQSSKKHHKVAAGDSCLHCHNATGSKKVRPVYEVHSGTCGY